jgi:hypothetical protein
MGTIQKRCRQPEPRGRRQLCNHLQFVVTSDYILEIKCEKCGALLKYDLRDLMVEAEMAADQDDEAGRR